MEHINFTIEDMVKRLFTISKANDVTEKRKTLCFKTGLNLEEFIWDNEKNLRSVLEAERKKGNKKVGLKFVYIPEDNAFRVKLKRKRTLLAFKLN